MFFGSSDATVIGSVWGSVAIGMWLVCCCNVASLAAVIVAGAGYANRIKVEEGALEKELVHAYSDYMQRTKRLIPFVV